MKRSAKSISACLLCLCLAFPAVAADAPQPRSADAPTLEHIHVYCTQLEPMIAFWTKAFDAQVTLRRKFGNDDGAVINVGPVPLFIQQTNAEAGKSGAVAYDHVGLRVVDIEASLKQALAVPGAKLHRGIQPAGAAKTAFVTGPEGILIELVQRPKP
ncbi:MAG: VOC family protein [Desulfovibrionaceae bacterium]|nr:VOC family protein [Desulfovibrionaceae bacterium]